MRYSIFLLLLLVNLLQAQNINKKVLEQIKEQALATHSDALLIWQDGKMIQEDFYGQKEQPIYLASAGKSLVSLAIGKLIDDGLLDSLDQSVYTLYPQWKQGQKQNITIRMLLNHTSGLQNNPNASIELEPAPNYQVANVIDLALAAELTDKPGEKVSYNNKAVALLGAIIERAYGQRMDQYFETHFFKPMGITNYDWIRDAAGNPTAHGAFLLQASDFLKFGQLMLQKGLYKGQRLLSPAWVETSFAQSQPSMPIWGLLWWRLPAFEHRIIDEEVWSSWEVAAIDPAFLQKMKPLKGQRFTSRAAFFKALEKQLGKESIQIMNEKLSTDLQWSKRIYSDSIIAYYADGYRGNYLVIIPEHQIVAVRCADPEGFNYSTDFFQDFVHLVAQLGQ